MVQGDLRVTGTMYGNVTGSLAGNASSASKWETVRYFRVKDYTQNHETVATVNGANDVTLLVPSKIDAVTFKGNLTGNVTGNCSGSSGSCTGNAATATKATQDSDGNQINSTYLKLSGGTMTGTLTAKAGQYTDDGVTGALDMKNSNIIGVNSIYTSDASEDASEGINFFRKTENNVHYYDTLWMKDGALLFSPNRAATGSGSSTSAANSQKVARLPATITSGQVVVTNGTDGEVLTVPAAPNSYRWDGWFISVGNVSTSQDTIYFVTT